MFYMGETRQGAVCLKLELWSSGTRTVKQSVFEVQEQSRLGVRVCVHACMHTREGAGPRGRAYREYPGVDMCQHLCAVKKNSSCCGLFIRFPEESGLTCGQVLHHNSTTCFIAAPGIHRNRFERQNDTDGEKDTREFGEGRKQNDFEECAWHRLEDKASWAGTHDPEWAFHRALTKGAYRCLPHTASPASVHCCWQDPLGRGAVLGFGGMAGICRVSVCPCGGTACLSLCPPGCSVWCCQCSVHFSRDIPRAWQLLSEFHKIGWHVAEGSVHICPCTLRRGGAWSDQGCWDASSFWAQSLWVGSISLILIRSPGDAGCRW